MIENKMDNRKIPEEDLDLYGFGECNGFDFQYLLMSEEFGGDIIEAVLSPEEKYLLDQQSILFGSGEHISDTNNGEDLS